MEKYFETISRTMFHMKHKSFERKEKSRQKGAAAGARRRARGKILTQPMERTPCKTFMS
jgi:hypothetical protein